MGASNEAIRDRYLIDGSSTIGRILRQSRNGTGLASGVRKETRS